VYWRNPKAEEVREIQIHIDTLQARIDTARADLARGTTLLGVYAAGLGIPFLLAAIFLQRAMGVMNRIKRHMKLIERVSGVLLLIVGFALLTGAFSTFSYWLLETFPTLAFLG